MGELGWYNYHLKHIPKYTDYFIIMFLFLLFILLSPFGMDMEFSFAFPDVLSVN